MSRCVLPVMKCIVLVIIHVEFVFSVMVARCMSR